MQKQLSFFTYLTADDLIIIPYEIIKFESENEIAYL